MTHRDANLTRPVGGPSSCVLSCPVRPTRRAGFQRNGDIPDLCPPLAEVFPGPLLGRASGPKFAAGVPLAATRMCDLSQVRGARGPCYVRCDLSVFRQRLGRRCGPRTTVATDPCIGGSELSYVAIEFRGPWRWTASYLDCPWGRPRLVPASRR